MSDNVLIVLVGPAYSGKAIIAQHLKRMHGFAVAPLAQPLYDALQPLHGIAPSEYLRHDQEATIPRLGRSVREIVQTLGDHLRAELGPDILIRRLVERAVERGQWRQTDMVIPDVRTDLEVEWARREGAIVWWVRRPNAPEARPHHTERIAAIHLKQVQPGDRTLVFDGTQEQLLEAVDAAADAAFTRAFTV